VETLEKLLAVYSNNLRELRAAAMTVVCNADEAEDIIQDTIIKLVTHPEKCVNVSNPLAYLRTCVRNEAVDYLRRNGREIPTIDETLNRIKHTGDEQFEYSDDLAWVRECVDNLPSDMKEVLIRNAVDGWTIPELAKEMGIPPKTLYDKVSRLKKKIRTNYASMLTVIFLFMLANLCS